LGLNDKKLTPRLALGGRIFAWLIFIGYTSIPVRFSSVWLNQRNSYEGRKFEIRISNPETNSNLEILNADPENAKPYDLEERTVVFAELSRAFVKRLPRTISNVEDARQFIRASGSIGANYIEANEALGKKDFVMKIK